MPYFAQLDSEDRVHTVCELAGNVEADNVIPIPEYDGSLFGKRYNRDTGEFEVVEG